MPGTGRRWYVIGIRPAGDRVVLLDAGSPGRAEQAREQFSNLEGYTSIIVEESVMVNQSNGTSDRRRVVVNLEDARQRTPKVSAVEAMRQSLQLALFGAVTENDVSAMAAKLKEMALSGDLKAMKMFFSLIDTRAAPPTQILNIEKAVVQLQHTVEVLQQSITPREPEDLIPALPATPARPTAAVPRSADKLDEMARRAENGEPLFHPDDARPGAEASGD